MRALPALVAAALLAGLFAITSPAFAQLGGSKVVRIVVPFAPGGGRELLARAFVSEMSQALGQAVIIDNRPGAGGAIGTVLVAKAAPDGLTMVLAAPSHSVIALINTPPPYDPIKDFAGVANIGLGGNVLMVNGQVPADRKSTRLNSSHTDISRMPSSA